MVRFETEKEDRMITFITMHELQSLSDQELGELYQLFTLLLSETEPHTPDHRRIRATLENIKQALRFAAKPHAPF